MQDDWVNGGKTTTEAPKADANLQTNNASGDIKPEVLKRIKKWNRVFVFQQILAILMTFIALSVVFISQDYGFEGNGVFADIKDFLEELVLVVFLIFILGGCIVHVVLIMMQVLFGVMRGNAYAAAGMLADRKKCINSGIILAILTASPILVFLLFMAF